MAEYGLVQIVAPAGEPVSLAEAKAWLKVEVGEDDDLIASLVTAAREYAETATQRALVSRTYRLSVDGFPCDGGGLILPRPPLVSVSEIAYTDADGGSQTLDTDSYAVDTQREPGWVIPAYGEVWPTTRAQANAVQVTYVAGYGAASEVPAGIKTAIKLMVACWYENREMIGQPSPGADALLASFWTGEY